MWSGRDRKSSCEQGGSQKQEAGHCEDVVRSGGASLDGTYSGCEEGEGRRDLEELAW